MLELNNKLKVKGEVNLVVKSSNGEKRETGFFKNLILDSFFPKLQSGGFSAPIRISVGTGSTPPAVTDTQLENRVSPPTIAAASFDNASTAEDVNNIYYTNEFRQRFTIGSVVGNIAEVAASFNENPSAGIGTRTLVKDLQGNPTTITVLATEELTVYYKFTVVVPKSDSVSVVDVNGTPTTVTMRVDDQMSFFTFFNTQRSCRPWETLTLNVTGTSPTVTGVGAVVLPTLSWSTDNENLLTYNFGTGDANFAGGIGGVYTVQGYAVNFNPPIPKTSNDTLRLTFKRIYDRF